MMQSNRTVVLGEASEESDNEEFTDTSEMEASPSSPEKQERAKQYNIKAEQNGASNSSILNSVAQSSSKLAKLVNYTSNYNPFNYSSIVFGSSISESKNYASSKTRESQQAATDRSKQSLSLLHRTLYAKNQQLFASLNHLYRHPLEKASKDIHNISQRLVNVQRGLQGAELAVTKIGREQRNLDAEIYAIV